MHVPSRLIGGSALLGLALTLGIAPQAQAAEAAALTPQQEAMSGYWHTARPPGRPPPNAPARGAGGDFKLTPSAAAYREADQAAAAAGTPAPDPSTSCMPYAVPGNYLGGAYQNAILVEPSQVTVLYEDGRGMITVHMNREHPVDLKPSWSGDSVGHWEGDTLVIDSIGFNGKNLVPIVRAPMSIRMHIVQRLTLLSDGRIEAKETFDDPEVFTEPFSRTLYLQRGTPWQEYICQENNLEGGYPTSSGSPGVGVLGGARPGAQK